MPGIDESKRFIPVNIAVLTVSDTRTLANDNSGQTLADRVTGAGKHEVTLRIQWAPGLAVEEPEGDEGNVLVRGPAGAVHARLELLALARRVLVFAQHVIAPRLRGERLCSGRACLLLPHDDPTGRKLLAEPLGFRVSGGGDAPVDPRDRFGLLARQPRFRVTIRFNEPTSRLGLPGERTRIQFTLTPKPLLTQWYDRLRKLVQGRVNL